MPKKTKKQKIIADYRRKILNLQKNQPVNLILQSTSQKQTLTSIPHQKIEDKKEKSFVFEKKEEELINEKKFFLEDIRKSLIVSSIIFLFLFLFYWLKSYILII